MSGTNNMVWKEIPIPEIKDNEVLVKIEAVGICGSDIHYYQHGKIGDFIVEGDLILGHESAGEVVAVGKDVKNFKIGDKVALEPGKTCGKCEYCKAGLYNLCPSVEFFATPPHDGVLANYVAHPEDMCFKLPDNVSTVEGALVEPLSVGLHAVNQGGVKIGDTVVVFGAGCIGLCSILSSRAMGATNIITVDLIEKRLEKAKKIGSAYTIDASKVDVVEEVLRLTGGEGAHVVIEAAGNAITVKQTVEVVKRGGTIVMVGMAPQDIIEFNFARLMNKEAQIKTVFRYRNLYPVAINAIANGYIDVKAVVSHEFDFENTKEAFDYVVSNPKDVIKAVIRMK